MDIFEKVRALVASQFDVDADTVTPETNLLEDLKADSIDVVELIMDLEQEFDVQIADEDMPKVASIQDIIDYIASKK